MKPKPLHVSRGRSARGKSVKKEIHSPNVLTPGGHQLESDRPSVEITKCISFQKFRYSGENRPGKKYQEKDFMELKLSNLNDKVVSIVIICTDAENKELIHPNGLVGKDCHDGIYDKEYVITKNVQDIKIPYLRTERIKTKKHECDNIQNVLEKRAQHLPSPYRERCLSQCNDKYTSARKFDTTKVCLGVIVTIVSHQGTFNGSLHAISHVVRNASEKTTLGILKLSQPCVSASEGGFIDIFTTEFGPEIEDGKYFVSVTYDDDKYGEWKSETITAGKSDILYKRIITYQVPPFALCEDLISPVTATLNLECPQSNQYCSCSFTYRPHHELIHNQMKRSFSGQENLKLSPKRMKPDDKAYNVDQRKTIKANLQNKLLAKQDGYYEVAKDGSNGEMVVHQHKDNSDAPQLVLNTADQSAGDQPFYMDLDGHQRQSQNTLSIIGDSEESLVKGQGLQANTSSSDGHQRIEVVAAGYSEEVPPDTTVLIYTTSGSITADTLTEAVQENQVILQEIPQRSHHLSGEVIEYMNDAKKTSYPSFTDTHEVSFLNSDVSQIQVIASDANDISSKTVQSTHSTVRTNSSSLRQLDTSSSSASASNNIMRHMTAPNKGQYTCAWEVASDEDNLAAMLFPPKKNLKGLKKDDQIKEPNESNPHVVYGHSNARGLSIKAVTGDPITSSQPVQIVTSNSQNEAKPMNNPSITNYLPNLYFNETSQLTTLDVSEMASKFENGPMLKSFDVDPKSTLLLKDGKK